MFANVHLSTVDWAAATLASTAGALLAVQLVTTLLAWPRQHAARDRYDVDLTADRRLTIIRTVSGLEPFSLATLPYLLGRADI